MVTLSGVVNSNTVHERLDTHSERVREFILGKGLVKAWNLGIYCILDQMSIFTVKKKYNYANQPAFYTIFGVKRLN